MCRLLAGGLPVRLLKVEHVLGAALITGPRRIVIFQQQSTFIHIPRPPPVCFSLRKISTGYYLRIQ